MGDPVQPTTNAAPRLGVLKVYFTAPSGETYRVYDRVRIGRGRWKAVDPTGTAADSRVFRPESGPRRSFRFGPKDARDLSVATLTHQLANAGFLATEPPSAPPLPR